METVVTNSFPKVQTKMPIQFRFFAKMIVRLTAAKPSFSYKWIAASHCLFVNRNSVSTGMSWVSQTHIKQRVISRSFDDPFKLALMVKDIGIAMELARSTGTPAPLSALTQQLWRAAAEQAEPEASVSVSELVRGVERTSGTEISAGAVPRAHA